MKRWLFNRVAAVSLLMLLAAAAAWAMSSARPLDSHLLGDRALGGLDAD